MHLAATVDADVDDVLRIELEIEPRAAVRDHARAVEQLAARVRLALVVIEEDARAAMQLADDDALRSIDDERARVGHERDLAEVDLLLLDVANEALATLARVVDHQLRGDLDRRRERHAAGAALVDVVLRLLQVVGDEHELTRAVEVLDREDRPEHSLKPDVYAVTLRDECLQELFVARLLNVDQVGDFDDLADLAEILADAEVGLDGGHLAPQSALPPARSELGDARESIPVSLAHLPLARSGSVEQVQSEGSTGGGAAVA